MVIDIDTDNIEWNMGPHLHTHNTHLCLSQCCDDRSPQVVFQIKVQPGQGSQSSSLVNRGGMIDLHQHIFREVDCHSRHPGTGSHKLPFPRRTSHETNASASVVGTCK